MGVWVVRMATVFKAALLMGGLCGCAAQSPAQPSPLVALPGPAKTEVQFREDDAACRTEALQASSNVPSQSTAVQPAVAQTAAAQPTLGQGQPSADTAAAMPPGVVYLRCMTARQNVVESLNPTPPPSYGYYAPYPLYAGVGFGYPFFYDNFFTFGFYHGGYGHFHGGHGGYGGFRNGGYGRGGFGGRGFAGGGFGGGGFGGRGGGRH